MSKIRKNDCPFLQAPLQQHTISTDSTMKPPRKVRVVLALFRVSCPWHENLYMFLIPIPILYTAVDHREEVALQSIVSYIQGCGLLGRPDDELLHLCNWANSEKFPRLNRILNSDDSIQGYHIIERLPNRTIEVSL